MYESPTTEIKADMRDLSLDVEKQYIADSKIVCGDGPQILPLAGRGSWYRFSGFRIGVVHEPTAIEPAGRTPTIAIRHTHLPDGDDSRLLANIASIYRLLLADYKLACAAGGRS